jgi:hypothetical protein
MGSPWPPAGTLPERASQFGEGDDLSSALQFSYHRLNVKKSNGDRFKKGVFARLKITHDVPSYTVLSREEYWSRGMD